MQFGLRPYPDKNIQQLTCSIRVDWISLPVDSFRLQLKNVRQGFVAGVFQAKVASPWAEVTAPRLQVSLFLPNEQDLDQWYDAVYSLPLCWPELTAMNSEYMHQVCPYSFHDLRKVFRVPGMWGKLQPNWDLLDNHLYNRGPGYQTTKELENRLVINRARIPGDDIKDATRPTWQSWAWDTWKTNKAAIKQLAQDGPVLTFPDVQQVLAHALDVARRDALQVELQYRKPIINTDDGPGGRKRQKKGPQAGDPSDPAVSNAN